MRIERTGAVQPLTPRVRQFLAEALGGKDIDDLYSHEVERPDFSCLRDLLVIELKTLEEDGSGRMENLMEELRQRHDWPTFIGSAPIQSYLKHTDDPDGLRRKVVDRIGRGVLRHLKKANSQLGAHRSRTPRKAMVGMLLLVNEDHESYEPELVAHAIQHALRRIDAGKPLYGEIDVAVYLTERHAIVSSQGVTHPVVVVEGPNLLEQAWKAEVASFFVNQWSAWRGAPLITRSVELKDFIAIEHIPKMDARSELWALNYRRRPYYRSVSDETLRLRFDEVMATIVSATFVDSPIRAAPERIFPVFELFSHIAVEMSHRAIAAHQFRLQGSRLAQAGLRLGFHPTQVSWLATLYK